MKKISFFYLKFRHCKNNFIFKNKYTSKIYLSTIIKMSKPRIIFYYQTLISLKPILQKPGVTHINLAAIHFGFDDNKKPYIHLNNNTPTDSKFNTVWEDLLLAKQKGIDIRLMVGGAGAAFQKLFANFEIFYPILLKLLQDKSDIINGVDLDVEESTDIYQIEMLISKLKNDLGKEFKITMAPVQEALQTDSPGLGGFIYKDLYTSSVGREIEFFNCQFYNDYTESAYQQVIKNGYPSNQVVMGMIMGSEMNKNFLEIQNTYEKNRANFGGVFIWEYSGAPSNWCNRCLKIFK